MNSAFAIKRIYSDSYYTVPKHYEHCYQVMLILNGEADYTIEQRTYHLTRGSLVFLNTLENHHFHITKYPYDRYILQVSPSVFQNVIKFPEIVSIFVRRSSFFRHELVVNNKTLDEMENAFGEMLSEFDRKDLYWEDVFSAVLKKTFIHLRRSNPEAFPNDVEDTNLNLTFKVLRYLDENYTEDINLGELGEMFYVSKYYLSHSFKEVTGNSVLEYVILLRINKAKALLLQGEYSVSEVAQHCGYTDASYFAKQFRQNTGLTPKEFRKSKRENLHA